MNVIYVSFGSIYIYIIDTIYIYIDVDCPPVFPLVAMEVKGFVGSVDANGTVQLSSGGQTVSKEDPTLKQLYGSNCEILQQAASTVDPAAADAVGSAPGEIAWREPWRAAVDAAARETIAEIEDRGDINLDACPIYEDLKDLCVRLRTEEEVDQEKALDLIEGGRMFLFLCEWDESDSGP